MPIGVGDSQSRSDRKHERVLHALSEREKELRFLYEVTRITRAALRLPELLTEIAQHLPPAWQYPESTSARIELDSNRFTSPGFREGSWRLSSEIVTHGRRRGRIDVFYVDEHPPEVEGPFLQEERHLIDWLAQHVCETVELPEAEEELRLHRRRL